jgi:nanoRNase/pAp phosphatase (c-di-AMP/oligoRNAs hydrolase)
MACEQNSDIDFCVIINMQQGAVSYRCTREDLDLGKQVAALYGGGGHPKTAGSQIDSFKLNEVIETILRRP